MNFFEPFFGLSTRVLQKNKNFVFKYVSLAEQILLQHTSVYSSTNLGLHVKINTPHIRKNLFHKVARTKHTKKLDKWMLYECV